MATALRIAVARQLLRPAGFRLSSPSSHSRLSPVTSSRRIFSTFRAVKAASSVSNQPGFSDLREVGRNAKEEVKKVGKDLAKAISGGNSPTSVAQQGSGAGLHEIENQVESLGALAQNVPKEAWAVGAAGFLPYIGTSFATIYLARQSWLAEKAGASSSIDLDTALALLHHVEQIQISYGAVILSFLGALHWGFEFSQYGGRKGWPRYLMGVAPIMLGWPSLLMPAQLALATQWAAFTGVWYLDSRATQRGWTPKWYSTYRFGLTAIVGSCILLTMGATGYYSVHQTISPSQKLAARSTPKVKSTLTEETAAPRLEGTVEGDIATQSGTDAYVVFQNEEKKREEEEKRQKEEAEEKQKEQEERAKAKRDAAEKKAQEARDKAEGRA